MTIHYNDLAEAAGVSTPTAGTVKVEERSGFYRSYIKRPIDTIAVLLAMPLVLPLVALLALIVALDGHNPFYTQKRVGRRGQVFRMIKLRSMVPNAERLLSAFLAANPEAKAEWDATQKLKCDPRITRIGRLIRKTSMDELPQLWNVLRGDMAIVGPRPMLPEQRQLYPGTAYYALRPGITGLWQVSDRNESTFEKRAVYDADYDRRLSFRLDVWIAVRTVMVVFRGTGY